jgi:hypothetical protein
MQCCHIGSGPSSDGAALGSTCRRWGIKEECADVADVKEPRFEASESSPDESITRLNQLLVYKIVHAKSKTRTKEQSPKQPIEEDPLGIIDRGRTQHLNYSPA